MGSWAASSVDRGEKDDRGATHRLPPPRAVGGTRSGALSEALRAVASSSPYHLARYSHASMSPAATSAMSCCFSAPVSVMMLSSKVTRTSGSSSVPSERLAATTARHIPVNALSSSCSCRRMLRMRAELSLDTSVAVFTYPAPSKSK